MAGTGNVRPGGRTARTQALVLDAALAELAASGWARTSVESVATRAGVHKTTIYRRWGTKERLIAAALEDAAEVRTDVTDSGDIGADLRALARSVAATLASPDGASTVRAIVAGAPDAPQLAAVMRRFRDARRSHVGPLIDAAIARGQLPADTDADELLAAIAAPLYYRLLMTDAPPTAATADRAAGAALAAARAGALSSA